jgi:hypothetical protein
MPVMPNERLFYMRPWTSGSIKGWKFSDKLSDSNSEEVLFLFTFKSADTL